MSLIAYINCRTDCDLTISDLRFNVDSLHTSCNCPQNSVLRGAWRKFNPQSGPSQGLAIQVNDDSFCLYFKSKLSTYSDEGRMTLSGQSIKSAFLQGWLALNYNNINILVALLEYPYYKQIENTIRV